ncbi:glycosyltransferase [Neobacillus niacini]|uniref:glycosyltransferase n=1 Tax=Neobacillus niacini TaxID=86668 RepID=UPI0028590D35|nr:glycosyltransferase [Neobacillus niacini]MDR6998820.1 glycosyltransferase involved in cell wall biosynthesis [Neobacillus niacini]
MKVLHLNAGVETGGGMVHILDLLENIQETEIILGLFEKGLMYEKALDKRIKVVLFNQKSKWDLTLLKKILSLIDQEMIEIVHTHGPRANFYGCFLKRKRQTLSWITTLHSNPRHDFLGRGLPGTIFTALHLWALKKPDHFLAISERFKSLLVAEGIAENKITSIFNGIDFKKSFCTEEISRNELNILDNDFLIIMVARLCPVKGHSIVFHVIKELSHLHDNIKLLVVGTGSLETELKQLVSQLGIENHILFLGQRQDVHALYEICDVKLLASFSESFPLVLLEAARAKKPVITSDVGGVRELIPSKEFGWIVPVNQKEPLLHAIKEAIHCREMGKLKEMGMNLYNHASTHFTIENFRNSVLTTYKKLG